MSKSIDINSLEFKQEVLNNLTLRNYPDKLSANKLGCTPNQFNRKKKEYLADCVRAQIWYSNKPDIDWL